MHTAASMRQGPTLEQILGFLAQDPANTTLLADAAARAFEAGDQELSSQLIQRYADLKPLPDSLINLQGLIAISQKKYEEAIETLAGLRAQGTDNPALRFNLAWANAMVGAWQAALDLLDEESLAASYRAPTLKIQMLHHLGNLDEALACGEMLAERYPDDQSLMGALANVAIDAEKADLALEYAKRAGDNSDGQATLGILAMNDQDVIGALPIFEEVLRKDPRNARALVGKGLGLLSCGDPQGGATVLDQGAEQFGIHSGSWMAAGWAYFVARDYPAARLRFEKAMALDPNFAETHGGIAVLDALEGKWEASARECEIALRLDKACFGAALAKSLLLQQRGHPQMAQKIINIAMSTPVGPQGETLAQMVAGFGGRRQ